MLREPPDLGGDIPQGLRALLQRLLAKTPEDRYASVAEVRADLARLASSSAPSRRRPPRHGAPACGNGRRGPRRRSVWRPWATWSSRPDSGARPLPRRTPRLVIRSIAVLPLDNYSGDPNQDYFAEGMTDELTANLATISQLRVISRGSVMQFKGEHRPPTPDIAAKLERGRRRGRFGVAIRRQGADHGPIDRRPGGQAPLGQELRAQLARRAGAPGRTGVGDRPRDQRAAHAERAVAADRRAERESRGARRVSQGSILLQSPERREPEEGDRAVRGRGQVESRLSRRRSLDCRTRTSGPATTKASSPPPRRSPRPRRRPRRPSSWTTIPPKRTRRSPCSSCSTNTTWPGASANSGERSRSTPTTRSRTISSAWRWPSRDGSTKRSPRAGARSNWIRCLPRS